MKVDQARLQSTLGRPELARLVDRLRARMERGRALTGNLVITHPTASEHAAISRLLGRPPASGSSIAIPLEYLEEKLRAAGICPNLRAGIEGLIGPVPDRRSEQAASQARWDRLFQEAGRQLRGRPEWVEWLGRLRGSGQLKRHGIEGAERLLSQAVLILQVLPASDRTLAELAASVLGDAHALDPDTSLGALVLGAVVAWGKRQPCDSAQARREAWAQIGIICDELSAPVLVLNLPPASQTATGQALRFYAAAGEPTYLSTRQLLDPLLVFSAEVLGSAVHICENPNVVAAAARRLGPNSKPLVCIDGQPRTATRLLLDKLRAAGISLRYHGDFDWPGIQIANMIMARHGALPWRMSADDYRAAATGELALTGAPVVATWDEELTPAMHSVGKAIHEEQITDCLLADLRRGESP